MCALGSGYRRGQPKGDSEGIASSVKQRLVSCGIIPPKAQRVKCNLPIGWYVAALQV